MDGEQVRALDVAGLPARACADASWLGGTDNDRHVVDTRATGKRLGELMVKSGFITHVGNKRLIFKDAPKSWYQCVHCVLAMVVSCVCAASWLTAIVCCA